MIDLDKVKDFGAVDADADKLLSDCFQDHEAFVDALEGRSFLVLGRKGSGKTAIYKTLTSLCEPMAFTEGYSFDDYPWNYHDLQAQNGVPDEQRYTHSWKYLILMAVAKILLNRDASQPWSPAARQPLGQLKQFVVDSYGSSDPDFTHLFTPERELHFKASLTAPFIGISGERLRIRDLPRHIQDINRGVQESVMAALNPECDYYVCFDQLDLGFSVKQAQYSQRLIGLLLAARELYRASQTAGRRLRIVVFLRDDIYGQLSFEDKNKITENYASNVVWSENGNGLTLSQLMASRFTAVASGRGKPVGWDDVFDSAQRMPGKQTKYKFICDRTFLRPRDMIKYCNEVLRAHQARRLPRGARFDNVSIDAARRGYSTYLLNELDDEIAKHVPAYRDYLEVIRAIGTERFHLAEFDSTWRRKIGGGPARSQPALDRLFQFSVVGYLKPGGRGGGTEYVWRYKDPAARFEVDAPQFRVHPGFKEVLGLKSS